MKREKLMDTLSKKYPTMFLRTSEEFNGNEGGIWTSGEESPRNAKGQELFDYLSESKDYSLGIRKDFYEYLEKIGWYCEWYAAGTIMIWEI